MELSTLRGSRTLVTRVSCCIYGGMADLTDDIEAQAAKPSNVTVDGQSATQRSLAELIEADKYLKANAATAESGNSSGNGYRGLNFFKFRPPGA